MCYCFYTKKIFKTIIQFPIQVIGYQTTNQWVNSFLKAQNVCFFLLISYKSGKISTSNFKLTNIALYKQSFLCHIGAANKL